MDANSLTRRELLVATGAVLACAGCSASDVAIDRADQIVDKIDDSLGERVQEFGLPINIGQPSDVVQSIKENDGFWYRPDGRMWVVEYPIDALDRARNMYSKPELVGMEVGVVALFQKCPHLGCRVPECRSSQWFECPCHGSKYNRVGEKRGGPAPRGMDRFAISLNDDGDVIVDTGTIIQGPPIGTNTTGQEPEGPNCIGETTN